MLPFLSPAFLLSTILLALLCVQAQVTLPEHAPLYVPFCLFEAEDRFFDLEVDIQPSTSNYTCDDEGVAHVQRLIQQVFDRKVENYFYATDALVAVESGELCGGPTKNETDRRGLLRANKNRNLGVFLQPKGWVYTSGLKSSFCQPDNYDYVYADDYVYAEGEETGTSGPPTADPPTVDEEEARFKAAVNDGHLRRAMTKKVNNQAGSCLQGTNSKLTVTITRTDKPFVSSSSCPGE